MGNFGSDRWVLEPNGSTLRHGLIQRGDGHRYRRSPGIGRAVAEQIDEAGANVVLADVQGEKVSDVADGLAGQGMNPNGVKCDITDPIQTDALAAHAQERFGSVDMLVNNAGNFTQGPFTELDHDSWHRVVGVNLTGTFNFSRSVVPGMVETGGGRVVNVSSMAGRNVSYNGAANDTASK